MNISRICKLIPAALLSIPVACTVAETEDGLEYEFVEVGQGPSIEPTFAPGIGERPPILRILLTDAPAGVDAVFVTIEHTLVQVCDDEDCTTSDFVDVMDAPVTLDLLTLQDGETVELAEATLPAGAHGEIQLVVTEASVVVGDDEVPVTVSSIPARVDDGFDLEAGMATEVTLDFDAEASLFRLHEGGWTLRPEVSMVAATMAPL